MNAWLSWIVLSIQLNQIDVKIPSKPFNQFFKSIF